MSAHRRMHFAKYRCPRCLAFGHLGNCDSTQIDYSARGVASTVGPASAEASERGRSFCRVGDAAAHSFNQILARNEAARKLIIATESQANYAFVSPAVTKSKQLAQATKNKSTQPVNFRPGTVSTRSREWQHWNRSRFFGQAAFRARLPLYQTIRSGKQIQEKQRGFRHELQYARHEKVSILR